MEMYFPRKKKEEYTMFARMTAFQIKIDKIDEGIKLFDESVIPAAKSQNGYSGAYLLIDRKEGKVVSITLWNYEEDAMANEKSLYYQEQLIKFLSLLTEPSYIREGYEVSIQA